MKKTKLFAVLLCLVLTIASFGFVACNNTNDTQTTHNYSQEWSFDKENHFHKCTDEGCTEVSEKAAHTIENGACTVCGYENEQSEAAINAKYLNFVTSVTEMKAEEGYTASIKDANVTVKNLPVEIIKDEKSNCETIDTNLIVTANIELFVGKDAKGEFTLKAHAVLDGVVKNADATKQKAYADVVTTANASATLVAESGKIYAHVTAETKYDGIPEEYKPYNTADTFDLPISMTYEDFINLILSMAGNDSDSIGSPDVNPAQMLISYAEKVFGAMGEILSVVDVDRMKAVAVDYIKRVINLSYNVTETENGYTVALDFNKVADVLNDFADLKASEFLNKYVMDGGYDDFCNAIINALDYNVEFIVNSLDKAGIDINEIVAKINANLEAMGGLHIGDITITKVEDFLNLGEGVTLKDFLLSDEIKGITVEQMIAALLSSNIEIKQGDIKNFISTMSATLKTVTFTEIIANSQDIEVAKFNSIYKTFVEGYKNILSNILAISVSVDKDGKFVSYNTTVTFGAETVKAIEDWAAKLSKIDSEMTLNENVLKSLARVEVGVSINFTKGKLVSDFDYKAFVEGFDATDEPA